MIFSQFRFEARTTKDFVHMLSS